MSLLHSRNFRASSKHMSAPDNTSPIPESANWLTNSVRFTVFTNGIVPSPNDLFLEFFRFEADAVTQRKAEFLSELTTVKGIVVYQMIVAGPKVDFSASAAIDPSDGDQDLPCLPTEFEADTFFQDAAKRIVRQLPNLTRMAVGKNLLLPVQGGKNESYETMGKFLPGVNVDPDSKDFLYRINRPRDYNKGSVKTNINRLMTWNCGEFQRKMFIGGVPAANSSLGVVVSLTTDVNTAPGNLEFTNEADGNELIETLFKFSNEIALKGDIS